MADLNTDATPLLSEEKVTTSATGAKESATIWVRRCRSLPVLGRDRRGHCAANGVVRVLPTTSSGTRTSADPSATAPAPRCPSATGRRWRRRAARTSLILGDSTDKLWHKSFCNELLAEEQRCVSPDTCATPSATFLPNNMQPFVCVEVRPAKRFFPLHFRLVLA